MGIMQISRRDFLKASAVFAAEILPDTWVAGQETPGFDRANYVLGLRGFQSHIEDDFRRLKELNRALPKGVQGYFTEYFRGLEQEWKKVNEAGGNADCQLKNAFRRTRDFNTVLRKGADKNEAFNLWNLTDAALISRLSEWAVAAEAERQLEKSEHKAYLMDNPNDASTQVLKQIELLKRPESVRAHAKRACEALNRAGFKTDDEVSVCIQTLTALTRCERFWRSVATD
jgi:hypothetical protein